MTNPWTHITGFYHLNFLYTLEIGVSYAYTNDEYQWWYKWDITKHPNPAAQPVFADSIQVNMDTWTSGPEQVTGDNMADHIVFCMNAIALRHRGATAVTFLDGMPPWSASTIPRSSTPTSGPSTTRMA